MPFNIGACKPVYRCQSLFPQEFEKTRYENGSKEQGRAELLFKYCDQLLLDEGPDAQDQCQMTEMQIFRLCPEVAEDFISKAREWAKLALTIRKEIETRKLKKSPDGDLESRISRLGGPLPKRAGEWFDQMRHFGTLEVRVQPCDFPQRITEEIWTKGGEYRHHVNDIWCLDPSTAWDLYIDESGAGFANGEDGLVAGVLSDRRHPLKKQPSLHAMRDKEARLIAAADSLVTYLSEHPHAGVLAFPVRASTSSTCWCVAIGKLIDMVLRLLPLPLGDEKVELSVVIEHRSIYGRAENFLYLRDACRFALAQSYPTREARIDLTIEVMNKEHPFNAYPDVVANACHAALTGRGHLDRLKRARWEGTCFLNYEPGTVERLFDATHSGSSLDGAVWDEMLCGDFDPQSILGVQLDRFGEEVRKSLPLWEKYLAWTILHLESKAIDFRRLLRQMNWLVKYQPDHALLPPRLQLLWLTAELAVNNHRGAVLKDANYAKFQKLVVALYEEDAPLTCWAVLHLAVAETNAFRFASAKRIVESYLKRVGSVTWGRDVPAWFNWIRRPADFLLKKGGARPASIAAIMGLQYCGQLVSSYGQHLAFLAYPEDAVGCFLEANRLFGRLSDKASAQRDISQTSAYLLTALMDSPASAARNKNLKVALADYFGEDLVAVAKRLAVTKEPGEKYQHHILLRYIHSGLASQAVREAYLAEQANWKTDVGHPWEMIEFYRALLIPQGPERVEHLKCAVKLAAGGDVTLKVIACVIAGALVAEGAFPLEDYAAKVEEIAKIVPDLGASRLAALRAQSKVPVSALDLAKKVLPFNFR